MSFETETVCVMSSDPGQPPIKTSLTPTKAQRKWLEKGLSQPGGKLPIFDEQGQRISDRTVRSCIEKGWAEPWFDNPIKPDWIVCKLTDAGRLAVSN